MDCSAHDSNLWDLHLHEDGYKSVKQKSPGVCILDPTSGLHVVNAILGIGVGVTCVYIIRLFRGGVLEKSYYPIFFSGVLFFAHCLLYIIFEIFFPQPWFHVVYDFTETLFIAVFLYGVYSVLRSWTRLGKRTQNRQTNKRSPRATI